MEELQEVAVEVCCVGSGTVEVGGGEEVGEEGEEEGGGRRGRRGRRGGGISLSLHRHQHSPVRHHNSGNHLHNPKVVPPLLLQDFQVERIAEVQGGVEEVGGEGGEEVGGGGGEEGGGEMVEHGGLGGGERQEECDGNACLPSTGYGMA